MKLVKVDDSQSVEYYRQSYYEELLSPIDGMWEMLYYAGAQSYLINHDNSPIGYCKIDDDNCLFLAYLESSYKAKIDELIQELVQTGRVISAKQATNEPFGFNACLTIAKSVSLDTYLYEYPHQKKHPITTEKNQKFVLAEVENLQLVLDFCKEHANFDDQFGYVKRLISRAELYLLYENNNLIATGECRLSDSQTKYADVGMIVNKLERNRGLATLVLNLLVQLGLEKKRKLICSTTGDNLASQKAITRAGFVSKHRIYRMIF